MPNGLIASLTHRLALEFLSGSHGGVRDLTLHDDGDVLMLGPLLDAARIGPRVLVGQQRHRGHHPEFWNCLRGA